MSLCLVTGSSGFIGSHLVERLLDLGNTVVALGKDLKKSSPLHVIIKNKPNNFIPVDGNILDKNLISELFVKYHFDEVYHLAGQSSPSLSWQNPAQTMDINFTGTINILDGALKSALNPSVVLVSSSAIYSAQRDKIPIKETGECKPVTPYGISKLAMDQLAGIYSEAFGMKVLSARPFFVIGPRKRNDACSDWARNIVLIERGNLSMLSIGMIEGIARDFITVTDAVIALIKIAEKGTPGEAYNICSGEAILLSDVLKILKKNTSSGITVEVDKSKFRPIEELIKVGDNNKLLSLGWFPAGNIEDCLVAILNYWRENL